MYCVKFHGLYLHKDFQSFVEDPKDCAQFARVCDAMVYVRRFNIGVMEGGVYTCPITKSS